MTKLSKFFEISSKCLCLNSFSLMQDDTHSSTTQVGSTPAASSKGDDFSITPPEAWGGEKASDKLTHQRPPVTLTSRLGMLASGSLMSGSMFSGLQDLSLPSTHTSTSLSTNTSLNFANLRAKDNSNQETSMGFPEHMPFSSMSMSSLGTKGLSDLMLSRRFSTYAERISTASSFSEGALSPFVSSPKTKKTGAETREEVLNSLLSRSDSSATTEAGVLPSITVCIEMVYFFDDFYIFLVLDFGIDKIISNYLSSNFFRFYYIMLFIYICLLT